MSGITLSGRSLLKVLLAGVVAGLVFGLVGYFVTGSLEQRYRAEMELGLTPRPETPPERISDYWEALSRGQASRIAAEVLTHRRWREPAAAAAGVRASDLRVTAGVISETSLITVGVEAPSARAAETAVAALVREGAPAAEQVSGPFALQVLQTPDGAAVLVSTPRWQMMALGVLAGAMAGAGGMLLLERMRQRRRSHAAGPPEAAGPPAPTPAPASSPTPTPAPAPSPTPAPTPPDAAPGRSEQPAIPRQAPAPAVSSTVAMDTGRGNADLLTTAVPTVPARPGGPRPKPNPRLAPNAPNRAVPNGAAPNRAGGKPPPPFPPGPTVNGAGPGGHGPRPARPAPHPRNRP